MVKKHQLTKYNMYDFSNIQYACVSNFHVHESDLPEH